MKKMEITGIARLLQVLIHCGFLLAATSFSVADAVTSGPSLQRFAENLSTPTQKLAEEAVRLDMDALLEFKRGIIEDPDGVLEDWNETKSHCQWNGVTCDTQTTRVVGLNLTVVYNSSTKEFRKQIFGTLGSSLSQLSELKTLIFRSHKLTGEIPAQFGRLSFIRTIDLHSNNLTGEIPIELSSCGDLQGLDVGDNNLTGELPVELAQCSSLEKIDVSSNRFTGIISPEFGRLQNLTMFLAMYNKFNGTIPASFGNCSKLASLALHNNSLTGTIPTSLANCRELQGFFIQYNNISGSIPPAMARMQKLSIFYVHFNQLEGDLNFLHNWSAIWQVHAENNNFSGQLPRFKNCEKLTHVVLANNKLSGRIPQSWRECPLLEVLVLSNNVDLTGPLPPELFNPPGKLQRLRIFSIYNTKINGSIPSNLGNFPSLTSIILYNNRLTGQVPTTLGSCNKLQILMLGNNRLDGEFAVDMSNMSQLQTLSLANNSITGDVSTFFSRLPKSGNLSVLDISRNLLKGELPSTSYVSPFSSLKVLMLGHNQLEGSLPSWLWNLPKLQVMDISNNHFHGAMPEDFSNLHGYMDTNNGSEISSQLGNTYLTDTTLYNQNLVLTIQNNDVKYSSILSVLTSIDFSSNEFTGKISTNINQLLQLQYLNLSRNVFGGEIPQTIGLIPLQQLDLSNNVLVGEIPQGLGSLSTLSSLELANNSLSGPIPTGQQISSFTVEAFVPGNDRLCGPPLPVSRSCKGSEAWEPLLSAFFKPAGFVLGLVVGFVSVAGIFLCWGPAQKFILLDKLNRVRVQGRVRVHNEAVGLWRPPVQPKL